MNIRQLSNSALLDRKQDVILELEDTQLELQTHLEFEPTKLQDWGDYVAIDDWNEVRTSIENRLAELLVWRDACLREIQRRDRIYAVRRFVAAAQGSFKGSLVDFEHHWQMRQSDKTPIRQQL